MSNSDQILKGINIWIESKVDELACNSIIMCLMHETIKRAAGQVVEAIVPVKMLELVFCNHGVIDADLFANEITRALNKAPEISEEYNGIVVNLKQGIIQIELPDTSTVRSILKGHNVINLRESDIKELAQCINDVKNQSYV